MLLILLYLKEDLIATQIRLSGMEILMSYNFLVTFATILSTKFVEKKIYIRESRRLSVYHVPNVHNHV